MIPFQSTPPLTKRTSLLVPSSERFRQLPVRPLRHQAYIIHVALGDNSYLSYSYDASRLQSQNPGGFARRIAVNLRSAWAMQETVRYSLARAPNCGLVSSKQACKLENTLLDEPILQKYRKGIKNLCELVGQQGTSKAMKLDSKGIDKGNVRAQFDIEFVIIGLRCCSWGRA